MINQKFKISFQISQPANIPQKCFSSTQNGPLDDWFQMRLKPKPCSVCCFWKNQTKTTKQSFELLIWQYSFTSSCILFSQYPICRRAPTQVEIRWTPGHVIHRLMDSVGSQQLPLTKPEPSLCPVYSASPGQLVLRHPSSS